VCREHPLFAKRNGQEGLKEERIRHVGTVDLISLVEAEILLKSQRPQFRERILELSADLIETHRGNIFTGLLRKGGSGKERHRAHT
jgi:hypothetical protein